MGVCEEKANFYSSYLKWEDILLLKHILKFGTFILPGIFSVFIYILGQTLDCAVLWLTKWVVHVVVLKGSILCSWRVIMVMQGQMLVKRLYWDEGSSKYFIQCRDSTLLPSLNYDQIWFSCDYFFESKKKLLSHSHHRISLYITQQHYSDHL